MPYEVHIDSSALIAAAESMKAAPQKLYEKLKFMIEEIQLLLMRLVIQRTPRDRSVLTQGIFPSDVDIVPGGGIEAFIGVQGLASSYVWPVELGAKPHWPPFDRIEEWVTRKSIIGTDKTGKPLSLESLTFIISRAIAEHGTIKRFNYHGAQMFEKATEGSDTAIEAIADRYVEEFLQELN